MTETKQTYETPTLKVYGDVENITLGQGFGIRDLFVFGIDDVIGNCSNHSCETGS